MSFYVASGRRVNFMAMQSLKTIRDLTVENDSRCKVQPRQFFTVKSFINLSTLHCNRINIIIATNLKMCSETNVWMLNPNMGSKFSYEQWEEILTNFQSEAA